MNVCERKQGYECNEQGTRAGIRAKFLFVSLLYPRNKVVGLLSSFLLCFSKLASPARCALLVLSSALSDVAVVDVVVTVVVDVVVRVAAVVVVVYVVAAEKDIFSTGYFETKRGKGRNIVSQKRHKAPTCTDGNQQKAFARGILFRSNSAFARVA